MQNGVSSHGECTTLAMEIGNIHNKFKSYVRSLCFIIITDNCFHRKLMKGESLWAPVAGGGFKEIC